MTLIRENRLHWPVLGIILTAILFIWKNTVPFIPPPESDPRETAGKVLSAKDYTQGLISLLHRNIPPARILEIMVDQWQNDLSPNQRGSETRLRRIRSQLNAPSPKKAATTADLRTTYARIHQIMAERAENEE